MGLTLGVGHSVVGKRLHCESGEGSKMVLVRLGRLLYLTRCVVTDKRVSKLSVKHVECQTVSAAKAYMSGTAMSINGGAKPDEIRLP